MTNSQFPIKTQNRTIHTSLFIILFLAAFLERTFFDLGPNVELVTMALILASFYLGKKEAFWLTLAIMVTTDRLIGNSSIFLFTWSGFLIPAVLASDLIKRLNLRLKYKVISLTTIGLATNLFFYFWTNFGVWILDSWGMYSKDFAGLINCYINALPFLKYQLTSTLIFIPVGFCLIEFSKELQKKFFLKPSLASKRLI